ncbi:MAG TPA: NHL repeat-containing protein [Chthoniobacterales bacterium]|nr:NHL repeat-containing protein [Chthoniobacterales bacterium]
MRKTNLLRLLLSTTAVLAAGLLLAAPARAAVSDIWETNNGQILVFSSIGGQPLTFSTDLSNPKGIVFDGNGHILIADAGRGQIVRFTTFDAAGSIYAAGLSSPIGLMFDLAGNLYESDSGSGTINKFALDGTKTTFASGVGAAAGLAFDQSGNLFVANFSGGAIIKITPDGTKSTFATGLNLPAGLVFDNSGTLYEADSGSGTIFKFAPDGTKSTFASDLDEPYGLALDGGGNIIVGDHGAGSTLRYSPAGVRTVIFSSDFNNPQFVAVQPAAHQLLNISTRGFVEPGDHVLIGGFVVAGGGPVGTTVVVRAIGPTLATAGIADPLMDPLLEVRNASGTLIAANDNWRDASDAQKVNIFNFQPKDDREAALQLVLPGGSFTAIVSGVGGTSGTALVEVYNLQ